VHQPEVLLNRCKIVCIGPITEAAARERGLAVSATANESTIDAMIELLCSL
jgi:uroporphyrinogen-III synthase